MKAKSFLLSPSVLMRLFILVFLLVPTVQSSTLSYTQDRRYLYSQLTNFSGQQTWERTHSPAENFEEWGFSKLPDPV